MLFRRKPKPPLKQALTLVGDAVEIAYKYLRDRKQIPTEQELHHLDQLALLLWESHVTVQYIARHLRRRARGSQAV